MSQNTTTPRQRPGRRSKTAATPPLLDAVPPVRPSEAGWTRVRRSTIHGRGLFAAQPIPKGTYLGRYEGERTDRDGCYVLWVENDERDGVYGVRGRNSLRFVNHAAKPNAEFDGEELFTLRRIDVDEEITVDYGPEWAE